MHLVNYSLQTYRQGQLISSQDKKILLARPFCIRGTAAANAVVITMQGMVE
jgi:hypothetical protein